MRITGRWGHLDGSDKRPVPVNQANPTTAEKQEASQRDHENQVAAYLLGQRLPDSIAMNIDKIPNCAGAVGRRLPHLHSQERICQNQPSSIIP